VTGVQRETAPNVFTEITVVHNVEGDVETGAVRRSIELSATKYCTVSAQIASGAGADQPPLHDPTPGGSGHRACRRIGRGRGHRPDARRPHNAARRVGRDHMTAAGTLDRRPAPRFRVARANLLFGVAVLAAYAAAAPGRPSGQRESRSDDARRRTSPWRNLDSDSLKGAVDTVNVGGRYYLAVGPLQLLPYLPFAAVPALQGIGRYLACLLFGIPAAWLSLPLARAFGARGADAFWIAAFTAFGSLLFYVSVFGDMYYLAHAEAFLP